MENLCVCVCDECPCVTRVLWDCECDECMLGVCHVYECRMHVCVLMFALICIYDISGRERAREREREM